MTLSFLTWKTNRRRVLTSASAVGLLALSGCGEKKGNSNEADHLARIRQAGEITIATEGTWAPWTYHDAAGNLTGFDIEMGRLIAQKLAVKAHFIEGKWDGLLAGIDAGRFDIMINGVDITPEREKAFTFSEPYVFNRTIVMTRKDRNTIKTLADLKGLHTANTISSTYAEIAEKYGASVSGVDDLNQTFELLLNGQIDATLNAEVTYYDYMRAHPNAPIRIAAVDPDVIAVGIPMKKTPDNDSLKKQIDSIIEELRHSGDLAKLSQQFFGGDLTRKPEGQK